MRIIDNIGLPGVVKIIKDLLEDFDTKELGNIYLTVKETNKKNPTWGFCYPPDYKKKWTEKILH